MHLNADAVAADAAGNFVVVWQDWRSDQSQYVLLFKRSSDSGLALSPPTPIDTGGGGAAPMAPAVAMNSRGDFVVTWTAARFLPGNQLDYDAFARRFAPDGTPVGDVIPLNGNAEFHQTNNRAAVDEQGGFVATWTKSGHEGPAPVPFLASGDVYARRFDRAGQPLGPEFRVNDHTDQTQTFPDVAVDVDGDFVVAWHGYGPGPLVVSPWAQRFAADGSRRGGQFRLSGNEGGSLPRIAADADGDFAAVFNVSLGGTVNVEVRRFDRDGQPLGEPVVANSVPESADRLLIDMAPGGAFVVGWFHNRPGNRNIYGRFFSAYGAPIGPEFRMAETTSNRYNSPAGIAIADDGDFVAAWISQATGDAGPPPDLYARRFDGPDAPPAVVGRHVFYNGSSFDGRIDEAHPQDDSAIATDKVALRTGQAASFANVTSFHRGINGVMIDVYGGLPMTALAGLAGSIGFKAGTRGDPAGWADAPRPVQVEIRPAAGLHGSDRVTLIWRGGDIRNTWLRVAVPALPQFGLASTDVFYFGNLVGEVGNGTRDWRSTCWTRRRSAGGSSATPPSTTATTSTATAGSPPRTTRWRGRTWGGGCRCSPRRPRCPCTR